MKQTHVMICALAILAITAIPCRAEKVTVLLGSGSVVKDTRNQNVERGFIPVTLPSVLDSVFLDAAELVLTISAVYDTTEPLLIAALPATESPQLRSTTWSESWTAMTGGFTTKSGGLASMLKTTSGEEIRIDVTAMVRDWLDGKRSNYGVVLKSLSEGKRSTFSWTRDGRYAGANAKLVIHYSRLN